MTEDQSPTVDQLILDHLDQSDLPDTAENLVLAALLGEEHLAAMLGGTAPPCRPQPPTGPGESPEPIGTYLHSIEVTGFRGIGPTATLPLVPGRGLTIVTGRNGSGKSSFAEAAEFALTGDNKRWSGRGPVWKEGWRNLHATGDPRIRVRLGIEGHRGGATVECHWPSGVGLDGATRFLQITGEPRQSVSDLGWDRPLEFYRPFLSYSELGGLIGGRPSEMHDSLQRILGLGRLVEIETMLKVARREMDQQRRHAANHLPELMARLAEHPDSRARLAEQALTDPVVDLDQLAALAATDDATDDATVAPLRQIDGLHLPGHDDLAAEVARLRAALQEIQAQAGSPADEARAVAALLRDALRHHANHSDQPCPVCGGRTLDAAWAEEARERLRHLEQRTQRLDDAHRAEREARRQLRLRVPALPPVLTVDLASEQVHGDDLRAAWRCWDDLLATDDSVKIAESATTVFEALVLALGPVQTAARAALERRRQAWQPVADQIRAWIDTERVSRHAAGMHAALEKAISELRTIGAKIRDDKLAPVAAQATSIWNTLRQDSNVDLGVIKLAGTGTSRRLDLEVEVDGVAGAALSVMSQGELHSLALALFLPRATMPESPFRFLVIDDPVQSMDPAKVYGLAEVLARVAERRQVIVFTHDDRLPAAVRHLQLPARILAVSRLARSEVSVGDATDGDPAARYLKDARAIVRDDKMKDSVRRTIVCGLIRDALEYACHERTRIQGFRRKTSIADIEAAISEARGLRETLALALLGDRKNTHGLPHELTRIDPAANRVVRAANSGAHGGATGDLDALIDDARRLVERLRRP